MSDQANTGANATPGGTPGEQGSNNALAPRRAEMHPLPPRDNPRARGHSPAADARQQQQPLQEAMLTFADGRNVAGRSPRGTRRTRRGAIAQSHVAGVARCL